MLEVARWQLNKRRGKSMVKDSDGYSETYRLHYHPARIRGSHHVGLQRMGCPHLHHICCGGGHGDSGLHIAG